MKPFVKWQGGKSKEIKYISNFIPSNVKTIAEPFAGGAAVSFNLEIPSYLNDLDERVINIYKIVQNPDTFHSLLSEIQKLKSLKKDELNSVYYDARNYINQHTISENEYEYALRFLIVRQQCFSGMERYNSKKEFNVPWGRYKSFSCNLTEQHHHFLSRCILSSTDVCDHIDTLSSDTFLFLDPPYLDRAGYINQNGGYDLHQRMLNKLKSVNNPFLIIHSEHEFYLEQYKDFNITKIPFKYAQQFNGGNYDSNVTHLYITNYEIGTVLELSTVT